MTEKGNPTVADTPTSTAPTEQPAGQGITLTADQLQSILAAAVAEATKATAGAVQAAKEPAPLTARVYTEADMVDRYDPDGTKVRIPKTWVKTDLAEGLRTQAQYETDEAEATKLREQLAKVGVIK